MATKIFSTRIDEKLQERVKNHCKKTNQKIQGFLERALLYLLEKVEPKKK